MKNLNEYITEKFKISSKNIKLCANDIDPNIPDKFLDKPFPDDKKKRFMVKDNKELLWYKFWKYLTINGPISKKDLLREFNLKPTSYGTLFMQLSKENIILPKNHLLEAQPISKWYI